LSNPVYKLASSLLTHKKIAAEKYNEEEISNQIAKYYRVYEEEFIK